MSVVRCELMAGGCSLEQNYMRQRTVTEKFLVEVSSKYDRAHTVLLDTLSGTPNPIPPMHYNYFFDENANGTFGDTGVYLLQKKITRLLKDAEDDWRFWIVECTWGPPPEGMSGVNLPEEDPLDDAVRTSGEWSSYSVIAERDNAGTAITNSALDTMDPPIPKDDGRPVAVFVKNMWPYSDILKVCRNYKDAVNSDTFGIHAPGSCKIESITVGPEQERNTYRFHPVTFRIQLAGMAGTYTGTGTSENWSVVRLDRGAQILEGTGTFTRRVWPKVTAGTSEGEFLDYVNLNSDGTRRSDDQDPLTKTFNLYPTKPYAPLGLI